MAAGMQAKKPAASSAEGGEPARPELEQPRAHSFARVSVWGSHSPDASGAPGSAEPAPGAGIVLQMERERLSWRQVESDPEATEGYKRYERLLDLIDESGMVLDQLKEVKSYEEIFLKAKQWYKTLWQLRKQAVVWTKSNKPKNQYQEFEVPDEEYYPLLEHCVGYLAELNDSYRSNREYIEQEKEELRKMYEVNEEESDSDEEWENPRSKPKKLYRWVSTEEAKRAKKEGITYSEEGGGIPTSTKSSKGVAIQSGAVNVSKLLVIDTSKIPGFRFEYVPTRTKLKEVKIKCDVPPEAIS